MTLMIGNTEREGRERIKVATVKMGILMYMVKEEIDGTHLHQQ